MHELNIVRRLLELVGERAQGRRVRAVHLRVGALCGVDAAALRFCYDACTVGTLAAESVLEIEHEPGAARCSGCERVLPLDAPYMVCPCERAAPLERTAGDALLLTALEVCDV